MGHLFCFESPFSRILNTFWVKSPLFHQAFLSDGIQINIMYHFFVSLDNFVTDCQTKIFLGLKDGYPELTFQDEAAFLRKKILHFP